MHDVKADTAHFLLCGPFHVCACASEPNWHVGILTKFHALGRGKPGEVGLMCNPHAPTVETRVFVSGGTVT
jgi:hypothetical protein